MLAFNKVNITDRQNPRNPRSYKLSPPVGAHILI